MVAIIIIFVLKFPTIKIVIIVVLLLSSILLLLALLLLILVPSDIIDVITVTMIEDSVSPLPAKSEPKQISPHNNITILI